MSSTSTTWSPDALTKATNSTSTDGDYAIWITPILFADDGTDTVFIPFHLTALEETTPDTNTTEHRLCMPFDGYLHKIVFRTTGSADTCDFEIYKAPSGTTGADADQNKLSSTVSVEDGTAHTVVTANFGTNYSFDAGDVMGVKMTYESAPSYVEMNVIWKILVD